MSAVKEQEKVDRRVRKTRRALREAMQVLMEEKGYEQVTIEELTEKADIGRTTFYLHYSAKQDLLLEQFDELLDQLVGQLSQIPLSYWSQQGEVLPAEDHPERPICMIFQHAAENEELYRIVLHGEGVDQASQRLQTMMTRAVEEFFHRKMGDESEKMTLEFPVELFGNYFAGAMLGMIKWWLEAGRPYSAQEMEAIFFLMFLPGASQVIGMELQQ
ncbi:MAG: TetR/AcrR family transcriptional regulator [Anaerolineales bacterium]|nr:TetR/AcrR family transcriptional regulator [Anaerolineales bacterium]HUV26497.1 TetR/AcrR family transcriptional regulator [Anaerolineales bacterium]